MAKNTKWMRGVLNTHAHVMADKRKYLLGTTKKYIEPAAALKAFLESIYSARYLVKASDPTTTYFGTPFDRNTIRTYFRDNHSTDFEVDALNKPVRDGAPYSVMDFLTKSPEELSSYYSTYTENGGPLKAGKDEFIKRVRAFQNDPGKAWRAYDTRFTNLTLPSPVETDNFIFSYDVSSRDAESNMGKSRPYSKVIFRPQDSELEMPREAWEVTLIPGLLPKDLDLDFGIDGLKNYWVSINASNTVAYLNNENKKRNDTYKGPYRVIFDEEFPDDSALRDLIDNLGLPRTHEYSIHVAEGIPQPGDILPEYKSRKATAAVSAP